MPASEPTIIATSMGFFRGDRGPYDLRPGPVFELAAELAEAGPQPRVCYLGQAVGDQPTSLTAVYGAFADTRFRLSHLALFPMPNVEDVRAHLLAQDVIWVGGGRWPTCSRCGGLHGLDDGHARGLAGRRRAGRVSRRLDLLARRRYHRLLRTPAATGHRGPAAVRQRRALRQRGAAPAAAARAGRRRHAPRRHCTDDGVGLVYRGTELVEAIADRGASRRTKSAVARTAASARRSSPPACSAERHAASTGCRRCSTASKISASSAASSPAWWVCGRPVSPSFAHDGPLAGLSTIRRRADPSSSCAGQPPNRWRRTGCGRCSGRSTSARTCRRTRPARPGTPGGRSPAGRPPRPRRPASPARPSAPPGGAVRGRARTRRALRARTRRRSGAARYRTTASGRPATDMPSEIMLYGPGIGPSASTSTAM